MNRKSDAMSALLSDYYPWIKSLHIISVISWMAGLFYLPRLFIYHVEKGPSGTEIDLMFQTMEHKLMKIIMNPAMILSWIFGLLLVLTPGIVDWSDIWPWVKATSVILMTAFHMWASKQRNNFKSGNNQLSSKQFRMANEVPTLLMFLIVFSVVLKY